MSLCLLLGEQSDCHERTVNKELLSMMVVPHCPIDQLKCETTVIVTFLYTAVSGKVVL